MGLLITNLHQLQQPPLLWSLVLPEPARNVGLGTGAQLEEVVLLEYPYYS